MFAEWGIQNFWVFVLAGLVLNLTPGPDVFLQITQSLNHGWRAGVLTCAGICTGTLVHVSAAALGLGALIAASGFAFAVLKWLGAAYLVFIGLRMLMQVWSQTRVPLRLQDAAQSVGLAPRNGELFVRGFLTNVLNPKVAIFFIAFLPQFITTDARSPTLAFVVLGVLFIINSVPVNLGYVLLAAAVRERVAQMNRVMRLMEALAGTLFIGFGVRLALSRQ